MTAKRILGIVLAIIFVTTAALIVIQKTGASEFFMAIGIAALIIGCVILCVYLIVDN